MAVDTSGDAYVAGLTYSTNFPNPNCWRVWDRQQPQGAANIQQRLRGRTEPYRQRPDLFLLYPWQRRRARPVRIAIKPGCASNCAAYVVGNTTSKATLRASPIFPSLNAFQPTNPDTHGNSAGYVLVNRGRPGSLMYSTFLGGTGTPTGGEALTRIAVDATGSGVRRPERAFHRTIR